MVKNLTIVQHNISDILDKHGDVYSKGIEKYLFDKGTQEAEQIFNLQIRWSKI